MAFTHFVILGRWRI